MAAQVKGGSLASSCFLHSVKSIYSVAAAALKSNIFGILTQMKDQKALQSSFRFQNQTGTAETSAMWTEQPPDSQSFCHKTVIDELLRPQPISKS